MAAKMDKTIKKNHEYKKLLTETNYEIIKRLRPKRELSMTEYKQRKNCEGEVTDTLFWEEKAQL
jgi:hypothetical protein